MEQNATWIRVAGNATNIKAGKPYGWRCYTAKNPDEIPLKSWLVKGSSTHENAIAGTNPTGDKYGIVAWIDYFGSYSVIDDILYISLQTPTTPPTYA
jgi:hypothetical protein